MISKLKDSFCIDSRALSFFRIGLSFLLLINFLGVYLPVSEAFLSDYGAIPRAFLFENSNNLNHSLFFIGGTPLFAQALLLVCAAASLMLLVGYKTRPALFFIWVALLSLSNRNLAIASGADDLLRYLCMWGLFLPLSDHLSVDAALSEKAPEARKVASWGSFAFTMQVLLLYLFTGILKWHPIWHEEGSALFRALSIQTFSTDFGMWFVETIPKPIIALGTKAALWLEIVAPFAFLLFSRIAKVRTSVVIIFIGLHLGLIFMMNLALFPYICILMWLTLLPQSFWDGLTEKFAFKHKATLYYDEDCGFCRRACKIILSLFGLRTVNFKTAQSDDAALKKMKADHSWALQLDGDWHSQSKVFYELMKGSPTMFWLRPILSIPPIPALVQKIYVWVSHHRKTVAPWVPSRGSKLKPAICSHPLIVLPIFALCLAWNISSLPQEPFKVSGIFRTAAHVLRMEQSWKLFAPYPSTDGGEFRIIAMLPRGIELDAFTAGAVDLNPSNISDTYHGPKWRKFLSHLWMKSYSEYRPNLAKYFCRKLEHLQIEGIQMNYYLYQITTDRNTLNSKGEEQNIGYFPCHN